MDKQQQRGLLKKSRLAIPDNEVSAASHAIVGQLVQQIDWQPGQSIHLFEAIDRLREIKLSSFVQFVRARHPEIRLFTSQKSGQSWQIVSLRDRQPANDNRFDVVIVPMLGFDPHSLHRIGFGGGYYDRLLASQPAAKKIGVCYEAGRLNGIEPQSHDVAMDMIITQNTVYL